MKRSGESYRLQINNDFLNSKRGYSLRDVHYKNIKIPTTLIVGCIEQKTITAM